MKPGRLLALLVVSLMILPLMPINFFADSGEEGTLSIEGIGWSAVSAWIDPLGLDFTNNRHAFNIADYNEGGMVTFEGYVDLSEVADANEDDWSKFYLKFSVRDDAGSIVNVVFANDWLGDWHGIEPQPWDRISLETEDVTGFNSNTPHAQTYYCTEGGTHDMSGGGTIYPSTREYYFRLEMDPSAQTFTLKVFGMGASVGTPPDSHNSYDYPMWHTIGSIDVGDNFNFEAVETYAILWSSTQAAANEVTTVSWSHVNYGPAQTVYVNSDWEGEYPEVIVDKIFGYNAFASIEDAIEAVNPGGTIYVMAGTYETVNAQVVIDKDLSITGEDKETTIIKPAQDTGGTGDARGWFLVEAGNEFNLSNVTLDGEGKAIYQAIRTYGTGTIDNNIFKNFAYSSVMGYGIAAFANVTVSNNHFSNIARVGVVVVGEAADDFLITGNTYVGKGNIVGLDYGIEISAGAQGTITGNTISNCWGIASDGSKSAAIMVTELFGAGTDVVIEGNTLSNNIIGVGAGYGEGDESIVAIADNIFTDNEWHVWGASNVNVDFPVVHDENTFDFSALIFEDRIIVGNIDEVMARADYSEDIFDARMPGLQLVFPLSIVEGEPTSIDMSIEVNEDPADPPSGFKFLGNVFTLTMTVGGDPVTEFDGTFTLTLFYDPAEVDDLEMLDIYWYDPDAWVALGGTVDTDANSVTVEIDHFSDFALMEEEAPVLEPEPETPETGTSVMLLIPFGLLLMLAGAFVIRKRVLA